MATEINLKHKNGLTHKAFIGWSWTSFFFGPIPAVFRGDWFAFFIYVVVCILLTIGTAGIGTIIFQLAWCAFYNKWHARRLMEKGYELGTTDDMLKAKLGVAI